MNNKRLAGVACLMLLCSCNFRTLLQKNLQKNHDGGCMSAYQEEAAKCDSQKKCTEEAYKRFTCCRRKYQPAWSDNK